MIWGGFFDLAKKAEQLKEYEQEVIKPDFWKDVDIAKNITGKVSNLQNEIKTWTRLKEEASFLLELLKNIDKDDKLEKEISERYQIAQQEIRGLEFMALFNEEYDSGDAILSIHSGTGGSDAQDWTAILFRMYGKYCDKKRWKIRVLNEHRGEEVGIKSITAEVRGAYAYGHLKSENGVHRLVRISPFDSEKMRHTSFALVEVLPMLQKVANIEIDPNDLRIDTYLASGHGGQSVQTTYSAVRIVHIPTKITVTCQNERSQQQNKETALKILKSKLQHIALQERKEHKQELRGEYRSPEWSNQIRSYVLDPYQLVKDHRTGYEEVGIGSVLDGAIDNFIIAYLKKI